MLGLPSALVPFSVSGWNLLLVEMMSIDRTYQMPSSILAIHVLVPALAVLIFECPQMVEVANATVRCSCSVVRCCIHRDPVRFQYERNTFSTDRELPQVRNWTSSRHRCWHRKIVNHRAPGSTTSHTGCVRPFLASLLSIILVVEPPKKQLLNNLKAANADQRASFRKRCSSAHSLSPRTSSMINNQPSGRASV